MCACVCVCVYICVCVYVISSWVFCCLFKFRMKREILVCVHVCWWDEKNNRPDRVCDPHVQLLGVLLSTGEWNMCHRRTTINIFHQDWAPFAFAGDCYTEKWSACSSISASESRERGKVTLRRTVASWSCNNRHQFRCKTNQPCIPDRDFLKSVGFIWCIHLVKSP